jgi:hypothetical protein
MLEARSSSGFIATNFDRLRRHWLMSALFAASIVAGALVGYFQIPEEISALRRVLGGAIGGGGIAFLMTATKMIG